jgi:hypothetical protein
MSESARWISATFARDFVDLAAATVGIGVD